MKHEIYYRELYENGRLVYAGTGYDDADGVFQKHGRGKQYYENGSLFYEGDFADGKWHGKARVYRENGILWYEGGYVDNKLSGEGKLYYEDGPLLHEGEYLAGEWHGKGTEYYQSGGRFYEGDYVDGKRQGTGRLYYEDGSLLYEGEYLAGEWHGKGTEYYQSGGRFYEGDYVDGKRQGTGRLYYEDGSLLYEGEYLAGEWHGKGKHYYQNGRLMYEGHYADGKRKGMGKWFYESGALMYIGEFADNNWDGLGHLYYEDGTLYHVGRFSNGKAADSEPLTLTGTDADSCLAELDAMIGLSAVKKEVRSLINLIRVRKERERRGFSNPPISYHMVFTGHPGTGKTTVARLIGKIYASLGITSKSDVVETDREGLIGQYIGSTTAKTQAKIKEALGGILFIDEVYSLVPENDNGRDFGQEAIDCLLKRMEDHRDELIVIVAGYEEPMKRFLKSNEGLKSRFNTYIKFEDYTLQELGQIFTRICQKGDMILHPDTLQLFLALVEEKLADPAFQEEFSNGRYARNIFEKLLKVQADRLSSVNIRAMDNHAFKEIRAEDLQALIDAGKTDEGT